MRISLYNLFIVLALSCFTKKIYGQTLTSFRHRAVTLQSDSMITVHVLPLSLQKDSYIHNLTFFCRQEWKLEKALGIAFRFRIGSLEQCNSLEGKK